MKPLKDLEALANGVNYALATLNGGRAIEFMLVIAQPSGQGEITYRSITQMSAAQTRRVGQHLIDMADAQEPELDPYEDTDVQGHA